MVDVSRHIVEAYFIHRALTNVHELKEKEATKHIDKRVMYQALTYPNKEDTHKLNFTGSMSEFSSCSKKYKKSLEIEHFLRNCDFAPSSNTNSTRPITWAELYVVYRGRGHNKIIDDPKNKGAARATAYQQIQAFTNNIKAVSSRILQDSDDSGLIKACTSCNDSHIGLGIKGKHASISCNIYLTNEERLNVAKRITLLARNLSNKYINEFIYDNKPIHPIDLKLNGRAAWDSSNPILTKAYDANTPEENALNISEEGPPVTSFFECRHCGAYEFSSHPAFQFKDLDKRQKCHECKKCIAVRYWNCRCGSKWYQCPRHRKCALSHIKKVSAASQAPNTPREFKRSKVTPSAPQAALKRKRDDNSDEDVAEHTMTHDRDGGVNLGLQRPPSVLVHANLISPSLIRRFQIGGATSSRS